MGIHAVIIYFALCLSICIMGFYENYLYNDFYVDCY